ncbi:hypothetical protein [Paenibacillus eucommiae]|uniref:Magnesium-transporting ATPase (P-type) n=1 Tax=Paenibacillus eucommiae TaxID=1355755 RepID=A0ABS4J5C2_9BACL|nr:hypothetical protein [Paenibacillus eucommiae]MBP1995027.1 magnesium-transporting ATPase (P-type) [Paenibacillus eucommiae]
MWMLPGRRSKAWLIWFIVYGVVLTLLLWLNRYIVLGEDFEARHAFAFAAMALIIAIAANGLGWLGARHIWLYTTIGTVAGWLLMLFYSTRDMTGWEDLSSLLGFFVGVIGGVVIGIVVEGVVWLIKARR